MAKAKQQELDPDWACRNEEAQAIFTHLVRLMPGPETFRRLRRMCSILNDTAAGLKEWEEKAENAEDEKDDMFTQEEVDEMVSEAEVAITQVLVSWGVEAGADPMDARISLMETPAVAEVIRIVAMLPPAGGIPARMTHADRLAVVGAVGRLCEAGQAPPEAVADYVAGRTLARMFTTDDPETKSGLAALHKSLNDYALEGFA